MSNENNEQSLPRKTPRQDSYTAALEKLLDPSILNQVDKQAKKIVQTDLSLCQSTSREETTKICFAADTKDGVACAKLAGKLEDLLDGYQDVTVVNKQAYTPARFKSMYTKETPLKDTQALQQFIDSCKTDTGSSQKKLR